MSSITGFSGGSGKVSISGLSGGSSSGGSSGSGDTFINIFVTGLATIAEAVISILNVTNLTADQITVNDLIITGSVSQDGNLDVTGYLHVLGAFTVGTDITSPASVLFGSLTVHDQVEATSLKITGVSDFEGDVNVAGSLDAAGEVSMGGLVTVSGILNANGSIVTNAIDSPDVLEMTAVGVMNLSAGEAFNIDSADIVDITGGTSVNINSILIVDINGATAVNVDSVFDINLTALKINANGLLTGPLGIEVGDAGSGLLDITNAEGIQTSISNIVTPTQVGYLSDLPGHLGSFFARLAADNTFTQHNYQTLTNDLSNTQAITSILDVQNMIYDTHANLHLESPSTTGIYGANGDWATGCIIMGPDAARNINSSANFCTYIGLNAGRYLSGLSNVFIGTNCMAGPYFASVQGFICVGGDIQSTGGSSNCCAFGNNAVITKDNVVVLGGVSATVIVPNAIEIDTPPLACTVVGISGTGDCFMPFRGTAYKKVLISIDNLEGVCTVNFPVPFTQPPILACFSASVAPSDITTLNTTTIEITIVGTSKTGIYSLEGF